MTLLRHLWADATEPRPLRPHQDLALQELRRALVEGCSRVVLQLPTGAGKTRIAAEIIKGAQAKGNRLCFTVPSISLIDQTVAAFEGEGIFDLGVIQANHPRTHYGMPVQVASVQTLSRRTLPKTDIVVVDECHMRFKVVTDWMTASPDVLFIGLSATPWAKGMANHWQKLITPVRMHELINAGILSPFRVFAPSHPDLAGVRIVAGDYDEGQLAAVMGDNQLVADVVETWLRQSERRPTLVFAVNRAHARQLQRQLFRADVAMGYCDANTDRVERQLLFAEMACGNLAGIVNVGTLTTGVDADIRCIVMARPTKSEMLFVQSIGRGLRPAEGKADCLILDHADNHSRLGFVTDIHYANLQGKKDKPLRTRKERGEPMPKECLACGVLKPPNAAVCPACGFKAERQSEVRVAEGELVERRPGKGKATFEDKQAFWSMALFVDGQRGKNGKMAKALYRGKFKEWPRDLAWEPKEPTPEFLSYEYSRRIAYHKRRENAA
ncbi:ATP-dependent helicase [Erythrobacter arachoides]|uniref:ATP-dependent helicase n=1 Tax=Aurantiacibacter arachoides TaxID=1850444 RepID=A0A845A130_9SPHN|nr:DEAD/DEAH box helicase [Aurantiacibacter arachoides]MXO93260.1 ATP-dependent helicase [Aurantiacibacter arachoides]GGD50713.1 helicase [Aurantiacibacter arachoides]